MEEQIVIGDRLAVAGADGKPEAIVEVTGIVSRESGVTYEVRRVGSKRRPKPTHAAELFRLRVMADPG